MKTQPLYFPSAEWDILYGGAWVALVKYTLSRKDAREAFQHETGMNLSALASRAPLTAMIDGATGYQDECMAAWCDWVTKELWGEAESSALPA